MNKIVHPLRLRMKSDAVADLQDCLQLLMDKGVLKLSDTERKTFKKRLSTERTKKTYGKTTSELVSLFQKKYRQQATGEVDDPTVALFNQLVEAQQPQPHIRFVVKGRVAHADGKPFTNNLVRLYDRDLRSEELLGESKTDEHGHHEIDYGHKKFWGAEKVAADLRVCAYDQDGCEVVSSVILGNAGANRTVDLIVGGEIYREPSENKQLPTEYSLSQNHPNPFNSITNIPFALPENAHVKLIVYDMLGRRAALLVDGWRGAGSHEVTFDGSDLATGIYFIRFRAGNYVGVQKIVLMK